MGVGIGSSFKGQFMQGVNPHSRIAQGFAAQNAIAVAGQNKTQLPRDPQGRYT